MNKRRLVSLLKKRGFAPKGQSNGAVTTAVKSYQKWHGLVVDGDAGPVTQASIEEFRFCKHPDRMQANASQCKWPRSIADNLGLVVRDEFKPHSRDDVERIFQTALERWMAVCNLTASVRGTGHIIATYGRIDRAGGTLAWSELPCGNVSQVMQKYDSNDFANRLPMLLDTAIHEIGHALGWGHSNDQNDIMYPSLRGGQRIGPWSIREAVKRYGEPKPRPVPPDDDDRPVETWVITGRGIKVEKLRGSLG